MDDDENLNLIDEKDEDKEMGRHHFEENFLLSKCINEN